MTEQQLIINKAINFELRRVDARFTYELTNDGISQSRSNGDSGYLEALLKIYYDDKWVWGAPIRIQGRLVEYTIAHRRDKFLWGVIKRRAIKALKHFLEPGEKKHG